MHDDRALRLDAQLCFALHATSRAVVQPYEPLLAALGVTYTQYLALLVLWETDGATIGTLGDRLFLDSGTVTPLAKRMETNGFVSRKRSKADERVVEVWLTAKGRTAKTRARAIPKNMLCRLGMTERGASALRERLTRLFHTLRNTPETPRP